MTSTHWVDEKAKPTPNPSLGRGIAAENWNRDNCSVFVKKWLKPIKWAKNAKNGKNERFLSGFCTNKEFLVIGFQCFVLSFQERPMNRPSNCSWPPKITENIIKNLFYLRPVRIATLHYELWTYTILFPPTILDYPSTIFSWWLVDGRRWLEGIHPPWWMLVGGFVGTGFMPVS